MSTRVVFDCMVFLQAAARPEGPAFACFEALETKDCTLCLSPKILWEVGDVLTRPELQSKFPLLTPERVAGFLDRVQQKALLLADGPVTFRLPRDPDDEPYPNLSIAADARYLVTWNHRHLGYLMDQTTPESDDFCQRFPHLKIVDPPTFLRAVNV